MLISKKNSENRVKFISYTGKYPNLCRGELTLEIDSKEVKFGHDYQNYDYNSGTFRDNNYDDFWGSGGHIDRNNVAYHEEWKIDVGKLPEQYREYAAEIDEVFNDNVPYGCCGGCIQCGRKC